jgi:hypothetical protein
VFNIAKGNGRCAALAHRQFIDTAHQAALRSVLALDPMLVRQRLPAAEVRHAQAALSRVARMGSALRGCLATDVTE